MSLNGAIALHGCTVTVRRFTDGAQASDGSTSGSWGNASTGVKLLEEHKGAEIAQRVFGQETQADLFGRVDRNSGILEKDILVITATGNPAIGAAGDRYRVVGLVNHGLSGSGHLEIALAKAQSTEGV